MKKIIILFLMILSFALICGCSQDDDDPDNVKLSGYVYQSINHKVGVKDVIVRVSGNSDDYDLYKVIKTDKKGYWEMSLFLGASYDEELGSYSYNRQMDCDIEYYYPDLNHGVFDFGQLLISGEEIEIPDFYLY